mgnify:CR=1 FL=1
MLKLIAVNILVIFSIWLNFLPTFCWSRILLLYPFKIRRNKIRTSVISCHMRLFLILVVKLKLALGLFRAWKHVSWYHLTSRIFVTTQVHWAKMVGLSSRFIEAIAANCMVWALVYHPLITTTNQPSACLVSTVAWMTGG